MNVIDTVYKTITENDLVHGDKILAALSGGADSVCLTHVLYILSDRLGIKLYACHLNHMIRGKDADSDEAFCRAFTESLGIAFFSKKADVPAFAKERGISEELAGREIRYDYFNEIAEGNTIPLIATAHNRNDNAETITMNFIRGSGSLGLCGIPCKRGNIIRPLLDVTRSEIEQYCSENKLAYVTDKTNAENVYTRNKIRLGLIPYITNDFNPNFVGTVTRNAEIVSRDEKYIDSVADNVFGNSVADGKIDVSVLLTLDISISSRVIIKMMNSAANIYCDVSSVYVDTVLSLAKHGRSGSKADLIHGLEAVVDYGVLKIALKKPPVCDFEYTVLPDVPLFIPATGKTYLMTQCEARINDGAAYFNASVNDRICIRNRRSGDVFYPSGMDAGKKVNRYFIDEKIVSEARNIAEIVTVNGKIANVALKRCDNRFIFSNSGMKIQIINNGGNK